MWRHFVYFVPAATLLTLSALSALSASCSSETNSNPPTNPATDAGDSSTATDARNEGGLPTDDDSAINEDVVMTSTVGNPCTTDSDCDPGGTSKGSARCSNSAFPSGTRFPTPVCVHVPTNDNPAPCLLDLGQDEEGKTRAPFCDGTYDTTQTPRGYCVSLGANKTSCLPACLFGNQGTAPVGCEGKNVCAIQGWNITDSNETIGFGLCNGGCKVDGDCTGGDKCYGITGECVKSFKPPTKEVGDGCTLQEGQNDDCYCLLNSSTNTGYCTSFCIVGDSNGCPTGFTCASSIPKYQANDAGAAFSMNPQGAAGFCKKTCDPTADGGDTCAALQTICQTNDVSGPSCSPPTP